MYNNPVLHFRANRSGPQPHRDGLNRCRECKKVFDQRDLLNHYKTFHPHVQLQNYVCEICKEENTSYAELFQHQREAHKTGVKDCPFCDKTIDSSTQMKYHLMRHEGMFPYNCPLCSNGYTANSILQDHIRRKHTGEKPFECKQCFKRFPTSGALAQHNTVSCRYFYKCESSQIYLGIIFIILHLSSGSLSAPSTSSMSILQSRIQA